jgi:hypothetical protein
VAGWPFEGNDVTRISTSDASLREQGSGRDAKRFMALALHCMAFRAKLDALWREKNVDSEVRVGTGFHFFNRNCHDVFCVLYEVLVPYF